VERIPPRRRATDAQLERFAVEATEYPDLARRYRITGVPKTIVNDDIEILGALPQDDFIDQALTPAPRKAL